jgi:hypothetical protein
LPRKMFIWLVARLSRRVRVFRRRFPLEDSIEFDAFAPREALACV